MPDQYTRTRAQLGTPALDVLRRAHVAVFGIGGVGGQAVEVLARSGVGELSLFDSDTVALSNLNRQLVALHSTLGEYKVDAMAASAIQAGRTSWVPKVFSSSAGSHLTCPHGRRLSKWSKSNVFSILTSF